MSTIKNEKPWQKLPSGKTYRWPRLPASVILLAATLISMLSQARIARADSNWDVKYWNNTDMSGDPVLQRVEAELNHDWGDGSPDLTINSDGFSARWKRTINVTAGTYRFTATMDDGMRVWIDGNLIIDGWWPSQVHSMSADVNLTGGDHEVLVRYFEEGGKAVAKLERIQLTGGTSGSGSWRGEYYANTHLSGTPATVRNDATINFVWGTGSPEWNVVPTDQFSVRWTQNISFNAGRYRFIVTVDDGARLWVNNVLIIDQWSESTTTSHTVEIDMSGGNVPIKMEYFENVGDATAQLSWLQISATPTTPAITGWRGEYFSNKLLTGSPVLVRDDHEINFSWQYGSPASNIPNDGFSARWTRELTLAAGRYQFSATTDDGLRLWVNNQLIIDQWYDHAAQTFSGQIDLPGGAVPVKLEYYDSQDKAEARLVWTKIESATPPATGDTAIASVTAGRLNVRQGPGLSYPVITVTTFDTLVTLTHRNADAAWVRLVLPNGVQGWVSARYLDSDFEPFTYLPLWQGALPTSPAVSGIATGWVTNAYYLNVRSGPGVSYGVITFIGYGQLVELAGFRNENASWVKVILPSGTQGWVNAYYLASNYHLANLSVGGW